jgi:molecular chaperone GrpE
VALDPREFWAKCYSRIVSAERVKHTHPNGAPDKETDSGEQDPAPGTDLPAIDEAALLAAVTEERDQLAAEKAELHDRNLRTQAEFQNLRRRVEKERLEFHEYAATEAVRALLPILDDFERALKLEHAKSDYTKGMELIHQRLVDALKKLGLEPIVSVGEAFDPHMHHAVDKQETADAPDGVVIEDYQRGYNFKGRLLRPAMVKVAVAPAENADGKERD